MKNKKVLAVVSLLLLCFVCLCCVITAYVSGFERYVSSPHSQVEGAMKDYSKSIVNAVDFGNVSKNKDVFDEKALQKSQEKLNKKYNYLASEENDYAGKTIEFAMDGKLDMPTLASYFGGVQDEMYLELKSDNKVTYPDKNYSKIPMQNTEDLIDFLKDNSNEEIKSYLPAISSKGYIKYSTTINRKETSFAADYEIIFIDESVYVTLNNIEEENLPAKTVKDLQLIEGDTIKVNLTQQIDDALDQIREADTSMVDSSPMSAFGAPAVSDPYALLDSYFESMFAYADEKDLKTMERLNDPIKEIILDTINNIELFTNVEGVDGIRDTSASCSEGEINFMGIIAEVQKGALEATEVVIKDKAYEGDLSIADAKKEIRTSFDSVRKSIKDANLEVKVTLCNELLNRSLTGYGVSVKAKNAGSMYDIKFDYLVTNKDSDSEVKAPEFDVDMTEDFQDYIGDLNGVYDLPSPDQPFGEEEYDNEYEYDIYDKDGNVIEEKDEELYKIIE